MSCFQGRHGATGSRPYKTKCACYPKVARFIVVFQQTGEIVDSGVADGVEFAFFRGLPDKLR